MPTEMLAESMEKYRTLMEGVKLRIALIDKIMTGEHKLPDVPMLESAALQLRKVLELIAFGSLVANKKAYSAAHANFAGEWNAKKLLAKVGRLNPNFYPTPVKQTRPHIPGIQIQHEKILNGYLTKVEFVRAYQQCSELIHTTNPYSGAPPLDLKAYSKDFFEWRQKIVTLLSLHELHLFNEPGMAVCSMNDGGMDRVAVYRFEPPPAVAKK